MSEQKKKKKGKITKLGKILILAGLIILLSVGLVYLIINNKKEEVVQQQPEEVINNEPEYVEEDTSKYKLPSEATEYQKELNTEINELVETEGYDQKELAKLVAKNFIAEYYTLSNVNSKSPGGLQYVPTDLHSRFKEFASKIYDFYSYYTDRDKLSVKNIEITNTKDITYTYNDDLDEIATKKNLKGYDVTLNWEYENGEKSTTVVKVVKWDTDYGIVSVQN